MKSRTKLPKIFQLSLIIYLISLFISFILYHHLNNELIINEITNINTYLSNSLNLLPLHFIFLGILLSLSLIGLSIFIFPIYILFESICLNYNLFIFYHIFKFKGLIFSLIYNILKIF